ncbi:uncharacterized protein LOC116306956 [Actinia tenebrosa]|uniref:Uncharacterized protein LOC116306956 n=1 Tax=Actinia tenebrosa TaxID=6105 RepID=A0A6P8J6W2_ACTTE|nr:uncharacterized protein LOC116306956 [Actinia tenebrosa]
MSLKVFVLLCLALVVVIMLDQAEGVRCRRKCKVSCRVRCSYRHGRFRCKPHCGLHCKVQCRGRDEAEQMEALDDESDPSVTLPNNLNDYDEDKDGRISFEEFKNVVPTDSNDARKGFSSMDKDQDSYLNCEEFVKSNLEFGDRQPSC